MPTRAEKRHAKFKKAQAALPEDEKLHNRTDLTKVAVRKVSPQTLEGRASAKRWYLEYLEIEHPSVDGNAYFTPGGPVPTIKSLKEYAVYLAQSRRGMITDKPSVFTVLQYMRSTVDIIGRERKEHPITRSEHDDLMNYVRWELSKQEDLTTEMHMKGVAGGEDVTYILSVLHSSAYLATFMDMRRLLNVTIYINMMIDCCGRGGDIAQNPKADKHRHLKWKDVKLYAFSVGEEIELGAHITYNWMKGMGEDKSLYKTIPYKLLSPKLANQDTLRLLLILALMDGILDGVHSWEQLMQLDGAPKGRLIGMKKEALELPVLRTVVHHTVSDNPAHSTEMQGEISRLGRAAGIQHRLIAYCLRRGIAFTLNSEETEENRKFLMGHRTTSRAYSAYHSKIAVTDVAALFRKEDVRSMENMISICLNMSHNAPQRLSAESYNAIAEDEEYKELDEAYRKAKELVLDKFPTLVEASRACDPVFDCYKAAAADRKSRLDTLTKILWKKEYAAHFESTICKVRSVNGEGSSDANIDGVGYNRAEIDGQDDDNHCDDSLFVEDIHNHDDSTGRESNSVGVRGQLHRPIGQLVEMDGDDSNSSEENGGPDGKGKASVSAEMSNHGEASHTRLDPDGIHDMCHRLADSIVEMYADDSSSSHAGDDEPMSQSLSDDDDHSLWDGPDDDSVWGDSDVASVLGDLSDDDWLDDAVDDGESSDEAADPLLDNTDDLATMRLHGLPTRLREYLQSPERQIKKISPNKGKSKYFVGSGLADDLLDVMTGSTGEAELCDRAMKMFSLLHPTDSFYPGEEPHPGTYSCRYCDKPLANIHHPSIHVHLCSRKDAVHSAIQHFDSAFPWNIRCNYQICGSKQTFGLFVQCGATFQSRNEFYVHMRDHIRTMRKTRWDKTKVLSCFFGGCATHPEDGRLHRGGPSFQTEDSQKQHLKAHHQIILRKGNPVTFCEICNQWIIDPDDMKDHTHLEEAGRIIKEWGYGGISGARTFVPRFCPFCYHDETKPEHIRAFTFTREGWMIHIAAHLDGMKGIARCPAYPSMCTKASGMNGEQLRQHLLAVHGIRPRSKKTKGKKSTLSISDDEEEDVMTKKSRVV